MIKKIVIWLVVILFVLWAAYYFFGVRDIAKPIRVGVLHSLTGGTAKSEKSVVDVTLMAIDEINQKGGLLGRQIEPIVVDGLSDSSVFAEEAEKLIKEENVSVIFGCWTSASRKAVKSVVEQNDHLLFYPANYEGLEGSHNVIYTGLTFNQQIIPGVKWALDSLGRRFFLVGSDYDFSHIVNGMVRGLMEVLGGEIVGEEYLVAGKDCDEIVNKIAEVRPDVVLSTIRDDGIVPFFEAFHGVKIFSYDIPVVSFNLDESEPMKFRKYLFDKYGEEVGKHIMEEHFAGNYACCSYFETINSKENKLFVDNFEKRYGQDIVISDSMEAAYIGVYLWSQAVSDAKADRVEEVRKFIKNQSMLAPEGIVYIDSENNHTWKHFRVGKLRKDGLFDIVFTLPKAIRPMPYPRYKSYSYWKQFLRKVYEEWQGKKDMSLKKD